MYFLYVCDKFRHFSRHKPVYKQKNALKQLLEFSVLHCSSVRENCVLTLVNGELTRRPPAKLCRIHDRTVARNLEGMLFRVKLVRPVPTETDRNRRDVLQGRQEYGNWFKNHAIIRHCVFIDECGYNIWTARNHRRARQGERA